MEVNELHIEIPYDVFGKKVILSVYPENKAKLFLLSAEEAQEHGESPYQLLEGQGYDYAISDSDFRLNCSNSGIVSQLARKPSEGRIVPNIYVGTLSLDLIDSTEPDKEYKVTLEVLATKFDNNEDKSYRENYRFMLKEITDKCTELLMQINAPIEQNFETDFNRDNETIYQRFSFINSIIQNKTFEEAVQKIVSNPKTNWNVEHEVADVRKVRRFTNSATKQLLSGSNRISLQNNHPLYSLGIHSVPNKINSFRKIEHLDTPENRFIKHALQVFLRFAEDCQQFFKAKKYIRPEKEATNLVIQLDGYLGMSFFQDISRPTSLKLNSPVLQRKGGYREILNAWLQFDLAAKLVWKGGDDVYKAGKRDIATLYEYWLFFTLYDLFKEKFKLHNVEHDEKAYDHLLEKSNEGYSVIVKQGKHTALSGNFSFGGRELSIKFSYNRSFKGDTTYLQEIAGSYTTTLRPDYTLSFWPSKMDDVEAEKKELIVHIHFDAKYKVKDFTKQIATDKDLLEEEINERKGIYNNVDLLKMHAYKDAIRRTGGAYVLYPGTKNNELRGFHEIIPGLGAFAINPSTANKGVEELSSFINLVIDHLMDRASQRENITNKAHLIYKGKRNEGEYLHEQLPEYLDGKKLIPNDTFVLVGYSTTPQRFKWYEDKGKYIFRMDGAIGSLELNNEVVNAKYLLLRRKGEETAFNLYRITSKGPEVFSSTYLQSIDYPPSQYKSTEYYLAIDIEKVSDEAFSDVHFNFKELERYIEIQNTEKNKYSKAGLPFTVTLTELMGKKVKVYKSERR